MLYGVSYVSQKIENNERTGGDFEQRVTVSNGDLSMGWHNFENTILVH
jgi:hypothetical protein